MLPPLADDGLTAVNALLDGLARDVVRRFEAQGFAAGEVAIRRAVDMRFTMQVHQLEVDLPDRPVRKDDVTAVCDAFVTKYELTYGRNSAYLEAGMEMITFRVIGTVGLERPRLDIAGDGAGGEASGIGERPAFFTAAGGYTATRIHDGARLRPGQTLTGPAIIQRFGDTVVVPPGARVAVDMYGGVAIRELEAGRLKG